MGYLRHSQDRLDEAAVCYRRALSVEPDSADAHNELGNVLKDQGDFPGADACYRRSIALKWDHAKAHFNLADIRRFEPGDSDLAALESLAMDRAQLPPEDAPYVHIALAKALEDVGDYKRSFEHLRIGNALKRAQLTYDEATTRKCFQQASAAFDREILARGATCEFSELPIFIVGMPRSGTTLVEQILATHCQVHAAGERINLDRIVGQVLGPDALGRYPLSVSELEAQTLLRIGQVYLSNLSSLSFGKTRATDKLPGNFFNVGLIRLIFPNARIVHVTRNAVDTCVSCFSKLFAQGHEFSYELGELGRYYVYYRALMDHWRSILPPGAMLELSYEELVGNLEGQARRLIEYCGLGWDDRCLDFHTTKRDISTASAMQVRQPIYRSALSRWQRFEPYIAPLLDELETVLHEA
jgi:tetratricopeptide (TPR) repeat protein